MRAAPLHKGHLFQAKYVPFKAVMEGDPWKSEESYSLDEVIYRWGIPFISLSPGSDGPATPLPSQRPLGETLCMSVCPGAASCLHPPLCP